MSRVISRVQAWLLVLAGVFNVVIWPRFFLAIVNDERAWTGQAWQSAGTSFLWVHVVLIGSALTAAFTVLWIGIRAVRHPIG